ncbi:RNase P modulator RnpM [Geomicrobium sp. JCM 19039]|uniref:RNase P modulator RnpM n=1 Tax=Geomicrobium sp. JCM 19039 TaxID=1460636 RepID=UPI00045F3F7C|nr:YlxR family protein [Geomicrobium sp. JCM 19039]GAK10959.1 predicted nucleic-acid-binding protein [Geomicrobium sp. JCM 19039]
MRKQNTPLRKCIVTNEMKPKKELIRLVRDADGYVSVDPTGKKNGRGAYVTHSPESFKTMREKDLLSRHLKVKLTAEDYERLIDESKEASR